MNILVTGAGGFVSHYLIKRLKQNGADTVTAAALNESEAGRVNPVADRVVLLDITDKKQTDALISECRPDVIYHLAAISSVGASWSIPDITYQVNVIGTVHLLEAIRGAGLPETRILLIGSSDEYGIVSAGQLPVKETEPLNGNNPYALSKISQEQIGKLYAKAYGMHVRMVRAFSHSGSGQAPAFVLPDWASQIASMERGEKEPVLRVGNIEVRRDFSHVADVVEAYCVLMECGTDGEVYNVGSGSSYSLKDLLQTLIALSSRKDIVYEIDQTKLRPADIPDIRADISKIERETGWKPVRTMKELLLELLDCFRKE